MPTQRSKSKRSDAGKQLRRDTYEVLSGTRNCIDQEIKSVYRKLALKYPYMNLVKGRGGSLLREKMVEGACKKFVVIVEESKKMNHLGGSGLAMPVEVVPFCWKFTAKRLKDLFEDCGCVAKLRTAADHQPFVTDNGNYIIDLYFKKDIGDFRVASDCWCCGVWNIS